MYWSMAHYADFNSIILNAKNYAGIIHWFPIPHINYPKDFY